MKQFKTILKFELSSYFANKVFVGITIALVLIVGIVLSFPRISALFSSSEEGAGGTGGATLKPILVNAEEPAYTYLKENLPSLGYEAVQSELDENGMKPEVESGKYERGILVTSQTTFTSVVAEVGMFDQLSMSLKELMSTYSQSIELGRAGVSPESMGKILHPEVEETLINTGKNQMDTFFYTYILIFTLYMAILLYGQFVTTSVATEKSSRAMELLITSAKPSSLMFGKVIGSGLAGMLQLAAVFGSAFLFFNLNKDMWADNPIVNSIFNIPGSLLIYMLVFFVLGFFIYAFLFGAIGSMASKLEDVNTLIMPVVLVFVACFLIVMFSMNSGNLDSPLMVACSYIPLTSSMAMFTRIAMSEVALWEILLSIAILLASTIGLGYLAARIYRVGVLMYGNKPSFKTIFTTLKAK